VGGTRRPTAGPAPRALEVRSVDAIGGRGLDEALAGAEVAYYLIHSMERPPAAGGSFVERERLAATTFAQAASRARVPRLVYLGGLLPSGAGAAVPSGQADPVSRHLASRREVEEILMNAVSDSIALRSSIVIGARSRSFRLLVRLVERLPVLTLPAWQHFSTQPIDARDIVEMLAVCAQATPAVTSLQAGGPDTLTYGEMLSRIAELMLVNRPSIRFKVNLTPVAARVVAAVVGEDPELVLPLMEGLQSDLLVAADDAAEHLKVSLHSFDAAVEHALAEWERYEPLAAR